MWRCYAFLTVIGKGLNMNRLLLEIFYDFFDIIFI